MPKAISLIAFDTSDGLSSEIDIAKISNTLVTTTLERSDGPLIFMAVIQTVIPQCLPISDHY